MPNPSLRAFRRRRWRRFPASTGAAALAALTVGALGASAASRGGQYNDRISGTEIWVWPATFVGVAQGDLPGSFRTAVEHTKLPSAVGGTATVTGGNFTLSTRVDGKPVQVAGRIASGGTISYRSVGPGTCGDQTFQISGRFVGVDLGAGSGGFDVTLVHHRTSILGRCLVYRATQTGSLTVAS
jgi:hypothetical protein